MNVADDRLREQAAELCSAMASTRAIEGYTRLANDDIEEVMLGALANDEAYWLAWKSWRKCAPPMSMRDHLRWALAESLIRTGEIP